MSRLYGTQTYRNKKEWVKTLKVCNMRSQYLGDWHGFCSGIVSALVLGCGFVLSNSIVQHLGKIVAPGDVWTRG